MDWMGLEKNLKKFDLFGIQTHPIPLNPHGLRANRTSPKRDGTRHGSILNESETYCLGGMITETHRGAHAFTSRWA
jgi:hypothetical protein